MAVWAAFLGLGLIWGSSFLLIKVGVGEMTPLQLITVRVGTGAVALAMTLYLTGGRFPRDRATLGRLILVGVFNVAVPFFLITWGEQSIDSGLATVLNSTVPLFSLVIAHFVLADERITGPKVLGLAAGFAGVIVLASRGLNGESGVTNSLVGQVAVLVASISYAGTTVFVRRSLRQLPPMVISSGATVAAAILIAAVTLLTDGFPDFTRVSGAATLAVLMLGLVNTYVAYLLFYWIIDRWGATRATLVTYLMPPVGLALGVIVRDEVLDAALIGGAVLIVAGVALANWRRGQAMRRTVAPAPDAASPAK